MRTKFVTAMFAPSFLSTIFCALCKHLTLGVAKSVRCIWETIAMGIIFILVPISYCKTLWSPKMVVLSSEDPFLDLILEYLIVTVDGCAKIGKSFCRLGPWIIRCNPVDFKLLKLLISITFAPCESIPVHVVSMMELFFV